MPQYTYLTLTKCNPKTVFLDMPKKRKTSGCRRIAMNYSWLTLFFFILLPSSYTLASNLPAISPDLATPLRISIVPSLTPTMVGELINDQWGNEAELLTTEGKSHTVNRCHTLMTSVDSGDGPAYQYEYPYIRRTYHYCKTLAFIAELKPFTASYLTDFKLDRDFPDIAPAQLAFTISGDQLKATAKAQYWSDVERITDVEIKDEQSSIFHDDSNGKQKITILARGDYNGDGLEDIILFCDQYIEDATYTSENTVILTRLSLDGPLTVLQTLAQHAF